MSQTQCPQGHFYSPSYPGDQSCPHCATIKQNLFVTQASYADTIMADDVDTNNVIKPPLKTAGSGTKTVGIYFHAEEGEVSPVVGWLVCEKGAAKGKDFRIVSGNNFIGRDNEKSHIHIEGDETISRFKHAAVIYEPKRRSFILTMGDSSGLVYHNGVLVTTPTVLNTFDRIELGNTELIFIPFCGTEYSWDSE